MPGSKIPVLEVEKLRFKKDARGLFVCDDGDTFATGTWTGSGAQLPLQSSSAWLKVTYTSGTSATETAAYIPVFKHFW